MECSDRVTALKRIIADDALHISTRPNTPAIQQVGQAAWEQVIVKATAWYNVWTVSQTVLIKMVRLGNEPYIKFKMERLGLIAGNGRFPILFAQSARAKGIKIIAVAIEGEASPEIEQYVEKLYWVGVAKMGKMIRTLKNEHIEKAVMAGGLTKSHIHSRFKHLKLRPDMRAINMWYKKLRSKHDHSILEAVANELAIDGIELVSSVEYVQDLLADKGCLTKRKPSENETADIEFGWKIAKEVAGMEIGQCIVVKDKIVLAVEAIEGTNETIKRGGKLGRGKVVVIKLSKKGQDPRFDVPTIGTETIDYLKEAGVSTLAIEAEKTLILDKEDTIKLADKYKIAIIGL